MIIKFDGIDGCGKSTLSKAVTKYLSKRHTVTIVSEFSSPAEYTAGSSQPIPICSLKIREAALDAAFGFDDIERQLLLHFLSRRKNRVEIPYLEKLNDYIIVDRSTLSNYAYAAAIDQRLIFLSKLACEDIEKADHIFWIDTPIEACLSRISQRTPDEVEKKGRAYFESVREHFRNFAASQKSVHILDGRKNIDDLVYEVILVVDSQYQAGEKTKK